MFLRRHVTSSAQSGAATATALFSPRTQRAVASTIAIPPPAEAQAAFTIGNQLQAATDQKKKKLLFKHATSHWKKAATLGHVDATHALGVHALQKGQHVLAFEYLKKAADAGHTDSCYQVGRLLLHGDGVEKDTTTGLEYLERAAEKQYAKAHRTLGLYYAYDPDTKDDAKAVAHFTSAIAHGDHSAHLELGNLYHTMDQQHDLAVQQFRLAVKRGDCSAMFRFGQCYIDGCCVPRDAKRAGELLLAAGDRRAFRTNYDIAERFEHGDGVPRDRSAAVTFYQFAWEAAVDNGDDLEAIHHAETALLRLQAPFDPRAGRVKNAVYKWIHHLAALG